MEVGNFGHESSTGSVLRLRPSEHASAATSSSHLVTTHLRVVAELVSGRWGRLACTFRGDAHHVEIVRVNHGDVSSCGHGVKVVFAVLIVIIEASSVRGRRRRHTTSHAELLLS